MNPPFWWKLWVILSVFATSRAIYLIYSGEIKDMSSSELKSLALTLMLSALLVNLPLALGVVSR